MHAVRPIFEPLQYPYWQPIFFVLPSPPFSPLFTLALPFRLPCMHADRTAQSVLGVRLANWRLSCAAVLVVYGTGVWALWYWFWESSSSWLLSAQAFGDDNTTCIIRSSSSHGLGADADLPAVQNVRYAAVVKQLTGFDCTIAAASASAGKTWQ